MMSVSIALASATDFHQLDYDLPLLIAAAAERGIAAEVAIWDDPSVNWSAYDSVIVRSCWDYITRLDEFLAWTASVPRLHNSHEVIRWNTDKIYLRELKAAGVPIIETHWNITSDHDLSTHEEWVVKPTVSAGSRDTARWTSPDDVYAHSSELIAAGRTSMTQPYIASVDDEGETAMLFLGGAYSHAIRKGAILTRGEGIRQDRDGRGENPTVREPTAAQNELAAQALAATEQILGKKINLTYARVDLVTAANGSPMIIELELTEPSLFLPWAPEGAGRLIDSIAATI